MQPVLEKMCDLLIAKNVAADIAKKLCESVAVKLDGKVLKTHCFLLEQVCHWDFI